MQVPASEARTVISSLLPGKKLLWLVECCFALRPQNPEAISGRGAQEGHLDFHTAPEL